MTEPEPTPEARVRRSRGLALVWLVPLAALAIVVWLGVKTLLERGPLVTITFDTAEGIEAGRTKVRHDAVDIGTVESVSLSEDLTHVVVTARMERAVAAAVNSKAMFWVVRPRISPGGITGLATIVSGAYLEMEPGKSGDAQYDFKGLEYPPIVHPDQPGRRFTLRASQLGGMGQGSPVYYRGVVVGEILGSELNHARDGVDIYVFVHAPYDTLVHPATRFWNAGGVTISAGAQGVKASIESLQSLVAGGVEFDTVGSGRENSASPENAEFQLFGDAASALAEPYGPRVYFQVQFPGPVHGLGDGSPVELKGINVGQVTEVHLDYDEKTGVLSTPAVFEIEPERLSWLGADDAAKTDPTAVVMATMKRLVAQGLRARLASGNLLTGQRMVALDVDPDAPPADLKMGGDHPELPVTDSGDLDSLMRSASQVMTKISQMPLKDIGQSVRNIVDHLDKLTGSSSTQHAVKSLDEALTSLDRLSQTANAELPALVQSLRHTADAATKTLDSLGGSGGRSGDLQGLMHELTEAARSLRALADLLQEHPEALLKGRSASE